MTRFPQVLTASTAIALVLPAAAFADLTAVEVWEDWKSYMTSTGYAVTASETSASGVLTASDVSMSVALGEDAADGKVDVRMGEIVFTENSDGSVSIALSEVTAFDITIAPEEDADEIELTMTSTQTAPVMTATGAVGDVTYDYTAAQVDVALDGVEVSGVILTDEIARMSMVASDVAYTMSNQVGDVRTLSQTMSASALTYDVFFEDPKGDGTFKMTGAMEGLSFEGSGDLPMDVDMQDLNAMLDGGFAFDGTFTSTKGGYDLTFNGPDGGGTINTASDGGTLRVAMAPGGLTYDVAQRGVNLNMLMTELPLPISLTAAEVSTNLLVPLQKSDEEQEFGLAIGFDEFTMSDALWGLFDAAGQLPRDPATLIVDLSGKAKVLFDFLDPEQAAVLEQSDTAPGELNALTLNALELDALGAKLTGAGDFVFDNSDLVTFDGLPRPKGAVNLSLVGGNGLLDKLVAMGLVPEDQAMGTRMMMGLFAVPGEGEDTLKSKIEVNDEGHVLANGQRLR
ncbi:DUF2125 domain-containing protein [uncultured Tateyamaria sp.]|uniref:DUF2125 domain-containing protein n=1 Tax=Tateyamaria sp. 1078 TaxID=3417464 RepID=UPI002625C1E5|nr:DUF2125 domain-containing protein [uncultured Tateyamaria sp.]